MSLILDGTAGVTFPNSTTQASAGSVLQVVQSSTTTQTTVSNATYVNSGLSISITPKFSTSKVLVFTNLMGIYSSAASTYLGQRITRNGSSIVTFDHITGYVSIGASAGSNTAFMYLDSPATTSSISYVLQCQVNTGSGNITWCNDGQISTITVMEIAG